MKEPSSESSSSFLLLMQCRANGIDPGRPQTGCSTLRSFAARRDQDFPSQVDDVWGSEVHVLLDGFGSDTRSFVSSESTTQNGGAKTSPKDSQLLHVFSTSRVICYAHFAFSTQIPSFFGLSRRPRPFSQPPRNLPLSPVLSRRPLWKRPRTRRSTENPRPAHAGRLVWRPTWRLISRLKR